MSSKKKDILPKPYARFKERFPAIADRYEALGDAVHDHGPLDDRERALLKLAISGSAGLDSAFKTHVRKARALRIGRDEIEHVALLLLPTRGLPVMMRALQLIADMYAEDPDTRSGGQTKT